MRLHKVVFLVVFLVLLAFAFVLARYAPAPTPVPEVPAPVPNMQAPVPAPDPQQPAPEANGDAIMLQGEAFGHNPDAPIKVEVMMVDSKIAYITVLEHAETPGLTDPAFAQIPAAIIEKQSADVDVVTGATETSKGIMQAVADALAKK